ncbi:hypothetical protein NC651_009980 [Populus alba x Populus x berolinensis]|nr:hypothetical protein NC651_009980 [Populus alba x Populus x berolinensis]
MAHFINVPQKIGIFAEDGGLVGYPKALDRECVMVNGAAVSALGKIMQFHRERLNVEKIIGKRSLCALPNAFTFLSRLSFLD